MKIDQKEAGIGPFKKPLGVRTLKLICLLNIIFGKLALYLELNSFSLYKGCSDTLSQVKCKCD